MLGLAETDDRVIWQHAKANGFNLVTQDADFAEMAVLYGAPPKVIWLRIGNCTTARAEPVLRNTAARVHAFLSVGEESCLVLTHPRSR